MKHYLLSIFLILSQSLIAQDFVEGQLLVQLQAGEAIEHWIEGSSVSGLKRLESPAKDWNIHLLSFDASKSELGSLLSQLKKDPKVKLVQANHYLSMRASILPNDPAYSQWQWNMDLIGAPDAWDKTTGGVNSFGDSIVIAVIDGGCDVLHEDLAANIWCNHAEIPNNGIDDDQNGFIDDYKGLQLLSNDDQHHLETHGSSVSGIIGAVGNNSIGMTGVNWNVKIMLLTAPEPDLLLESNLLKAYYYIYNMRRDYNWSNGRKGAYVVASNLSAGIDFAKPEDHPLWCGVYDALGGEGVLNVAATINAKVDVDDKGDMPTTCGSDYLIAVTNTTRFDALDINAGYGKKHIDLSAPGAVYSTRINNTYNVFGGTSGAAPHVTGAIGLLYSYPSFLWSKMQKESPAAAALFAKELIVSNASPCLTLEGKTVSGGRLDLAKSMQKLEEWAEEPVYNSDIHIIDVSNLELHFWTNDPGAYRWAVYDMIGRRRSYGQFELEKEGEYYQPINLDGQAYTFYLLVLYKKNKQVGMHKFFFE